MTSKLEDLIAELCPNGVEYKKIGDIADVSIGLATSVTKYKRDSGVLLLHNSDIQQGRIELKNIEHIDDSFAKKNSSKLLRKNDIITIHTGDVGTSAVITDEYAGSIGFTTITSRIKDFNQVYPYYLCTYFNSHKCKIDIRKMTISDRSNLNQKDFIKIQVPVPPLEVQREIVRILDNFTELTARKKQYEYYRDTLLTFNDNNPLRSLISRYCPNGVEYKKIGDIATLSRGKVMSKSFINDNSGEYPVYSSQTENNGQFGAISTYMFDGKYVTWTTDGANAGTVFYRDGKFSVTNVCGVIDISDCQVDTKYVYYALTIHAKNYVSSGMGNAKLMSNVMSKVTIPVPPLGVQRQIVQILDRFDALCNDLTQGLPAEIEARRKQYEYYRDQLLTFKRA